MLTWVACMKGDATAALAALASRNRGHLPEAPLADASASVAAQRGLSDVLSNARLRRRLILVMAMWCCAFMVCPSQEQIVPKAFMQSAYIPDTATGYWPWLNSGHNRQAAA